MTDKTLCKWAAVEGPCRELGADSELWCDNCCRTHISELEAERDEVLRFLAKLVQRESAVWWFVAEANRLFALLTPKDTCSHCGGMGIVPATGRGEDGFEPCVCDEAGWLQNLTPKDT